MDDIVQRAKKQQYGTEENPAQILFGNDTYLNRPTVLVASIGDDWMPGCKESMEAMCEDLKEAGYGLITRIIYNICAKPYVGIGAMRNVAVAESLERGADHLILIENDVLINDPSTLRRLLFRGHVVTPMLEQVYGQDTAWALTFPIYKLNQGLLPLQWTVMSFLVIDTLVFRVVGARPFTDLLINNEDEYVCHLFRANGVRIWQDTDERVKLLRSPSCLYDTLGVPRPGNWKPDVWPNPFYSDQKGRTNG